MLAIDSLYELQAGGELVLPLQIDRDPSEIATILWSPADQLDCEDCLQPVFFGAQSQQLMVEVMDTSGCTNTALVTINVNTETRIFVPISLAQWRWPQRFIECICGSGDGSRHPFFSSL